MVKTFLTLFFCVALSVGIIWTEVHAAPALASPADYGFAVPDAAPQLPGEMDAYAPPLLGQFTGPAVAAYTRTAAPDDVVTLAGPDFKSSTQFRCYGTSGNGRASLTAIVDRPAIVADGVAASLILPKQLPKGSMYLLWPKNGEVFGKPVAINRTESWWLGSDQALAGETVAVYGRNLSYADGKALSWIYLKPVGAARGQWIKPESVNPYRVSFVIPQLAPATYEVWTHNGHGGNFGWSGPLALTVLAQSPWAGQNTRVFNVKDYGALGDGVADETQAIAKTLTAAAKAAPSTIYFPAGTYLVNGAMDLKDNVSWNGESRDTSIIKVGPGYAANPLVWGQAFLYSDSDALNHIEFKHLTFDGNGNLGNKSLMIFRHHKYVKLTGARFNWKGTVNGFNIGSNEHLTISGCEFSGDQVFLGDARQVEVSDNRFRLTDYANAALISWGGSEVSITGNRAQDYDPQAATAGGVGSGRFLVTQCHPDSNRNFYIADNVTKDMAPPTQIGDSNQGEQILFEVGSSILAQTPIAATATTATFNSPAPAVSAQDAIVVKGRGAGQFRRVSAINGNTISVSPAWSVVPDDTSTVGIGPAQTRSVIYHNTLDGKSNYKNYITASVALSLYGNVSDVVFSNNKITDMQTGLADEYSLIPSAESPIPSVLYFNLIADNSVDGAQHGVRIITNWLTHDATGTLGHLGNSYRHNTLTNILSEGINLGADQGGFRGGDLAQNVFEHNTITNVPLAFRVDRATNYFKNPINTKFDNFILHNNDFRRGSAAFSGSKALNIAGNTTSLWRSGNQWTGFKTNTKDAVTKEISP